ncbi:MAG TPA: cation diffusion facilitator family transporter, partial [Deinococcales bacterium]|nr:cation diffusion facilitator family transporter [Deinococcales bacterium]
LESIVNVVAAGAALIATTVAARPADESHPFGHTKAEFFSALVEGALILFAAFAIVREAASRLAQPEAIEAPGLGLLVSLAASVANLLLARYLINLGRQVRSPAVTADGHHVMADVVTSVGVLAGVGLAAVTGWWVLDPLLAVLVAGNILFVGWRLVSESAGGLMDAGVPVEDRSEITRAILDSMAGAIEVHDIRTRRAGRRAFVDAHLVVPGDMTVSEAHRITDRIEVEVRRRVPGTSITVHIEPDNEAQGQYAELRAHWRKRR